MKRTTLYAQRRGNLVPFPIRSVQTDRTRKGLTLAEDHSFPNQLEAPKSSLGDSSWSGNGLSLDHISARPEPVEGRSPRMLRRAQHERFVANLTRRAPIALMCAAPLVATPAFASDFSGMVPYLIGAILFAAIVFIGLVFGVTHFIPWSPVKRGLRALAFGLFLAPVQYLSDGSPDTYDSGMMLLGPSLMFDEPFNGPGRIALSIAITTAIFYGLFWMISKLRGK